MCWQFLPSFSLLSRLFLGSFLPAESGLSRSIAGTYGRPPLPGIRAIMHIFLYSGQWAGIFANIIKLKKKKKNKREYKHPTIRAYPLRGVSTNCHKPPYRLDPEGGGVRRKSLNPRHLSPFG